MLRNMQGAENYTVGGSGGEEHGPFWVPVLSREIGKSHGTP
jgi:hypothetical protein